MAFVIRDVRTREQKEMVERLGIQFVEGPIYKQLKSDVLIDKIKESL
jgi:EAL domain-containing protein (putative c-di-GMP-specific phosphodiesterase class I)